jgi:hypothetical protein
MAKLSGRQQERIKRLWANDEALKSALWASVPNSLSVEFDRDVTAAMETEGKHLEPGGGNFYGGEAAQRIMEMAHDWLSSEFDRYAADVQQMCRKLDYCSKRRAKVFEDEGWTVAIAVGDALLQIITHIPVPIAVLSVYIVKRGILDKICKCK